MYPDIFFTPDYHDLFAATGFGGIPASFSCAGIDNHFYLRPVEGTPYFDTVSPYGYAGPVEVANGADWKAYLQAFHRYCQEQGIIAEFARLHPYLCNHAHLDSVQPGQDIVFLDLSKPQDELEQGFDKGCRSSLKKARRSGLEVEFNDRIMPAFVWLYLETMHRIATNPDYIFTPTFLNKLEVWLRGSFGTIEVSCRGTVLASAILLYHGIFGHYFLAGSDPSGQCYCPNNLLIAESARYFRDKGCRIFSLGGGLIHGDSLESFKRSFSELSVPFYTYRKIHNQAVHDELCRLKGIDPASPGYFPAYRRSA